MNAISRAKPDKMLVQEVVRIGWVSFSIVKWRVPVWVCRYRIVISKGSELIRV